MLGPNRRPGDVSVLFPVRIFNDTLSENEAGCILLFTCKGELAVMPAPRTTIVDEAVTPFAGRQFCEAGECDGGQ